MLKNKYIYLQSFVFFILYVSCNKHLIIETGSSFYNDTIIITTNNNLIKDTIVNSVISYGGIAPYSFRKHYYTDLKHINLKINVNNTFEAYINDIKLRNFRENILIINYSSKESIIKKYSSLQDTLLTKSVGSQNFKTIFYITYK